MTFFPNPPSSTCTDSTSNGKKVALSSNYFIIVLANGGSVNVLDSI